MSAEKTKSDLLLTERALSDIAEIERFSIAQWGKNTAAKYIRDIEAAFFLLQENIDLLRSGCSPVILHHSKRLQRITAQQRSRVVVGAANRDEFL